MASPLLTKPTMPAVNDSNHGAPTGSPEPTRMPTARTKASFFSPPSFMFLVSHPTGSPELKRMQTALTKAKKKPPTSTEFRAAARAPSTWRTTLLTLLILRTLYYRDHRAPPHGRVPVAQALAPPGLRRAVADSKNEKK